MTISTPQPTGGTGWEKALLGVLALVLPVGTGAAFWDCFRENPMWIAPILAGIWLTLFAAAVVTGVATRAKDAVIDAVCARLFSHRRSERREYLKRLSAHVEDIELAGVTTTTGFAVGLRDVYIDVSLIRSRPQDIAAEPLVAMPNGHGERETFAVALEHSRSKVAAVVGGPGSGKTTLLRHTVMQLCESSSARSPLPILLELRGHTAAITGDEPHTVPQLAAKVGWLEGKVGVEMLENSLDVGGCLVLLDGLDEVPTPEGRKAAAAWIRSQITRYPDNTFVITSRPYGYQSNPLDNADVWMVRRLTDDQISEFLRCWYATTEERTKKPSEPVELARDRGMQRSVDLVARLRENPALYELASNPLLLTMIALVHRYRGALPGSRAALYQEMCDLLLHRRRDDVGLTEHGTGLSGRQKERVAKQLARYMMESGCPQVTAQEAERAIADTLQVVSPGVTPTQYLRETSHSGLLVEPEEGHFAFAHLSLQEYLTAQAFPPRRRAGGQLGGRVDDPAWREVILLWVAAADATRVIESCLRSGTVRALTLAFDCADQAQEISADTRRRLESMLSDRVGNPARTRLITAVKVARELPGTIKLEGGARLYMQPISRQMYQLFTESRYGRHRRLDGDPESDTAIGMWSADAAAFIAWINDLFDDTLYLRLPTLEEIDGLGDRNWNTLTERTIWLYDKQGPQLLLPEGVADPRSTPAEAVPPAVITDRVATIEFALVVYILANAARLVRNIDTAVTADHPAPTRTPHSSQTQARAHITKLGRALGIQLDDLLVQALSSGDRFAVSRSLAGSRLENKDPLFRLRPVPVHTPNAKARGGDHTGRFLAELADLHAIATDENLINDRWTPLHRSVLARSYTLLIPEFSLSAMPRPKGWLDLSDFDAFLTGLVTGINTELVTPQTIQGLLRRIHRTITRQRPGRFSDQADLRRYQLAARVVADVVQLLNPVLSRSSSVRLDDLTCARIGLLASKPVVRYEVSRLWSADDGDPAELAAHEQLLVDLDSVLIGLTGLSYRLDHPEVASEVLALVRD